MIKKIEDIRNKNIDFQRDFFNNCTIEEKIDTHYVSLEIVSKSTLKFYKSNNKEISKIDLILNSDWNTLISDWNFIFMENRPLFEKYIGYRISMFFFPNEMPLKTYYTSGIKYLISRMTFNNNDKNCIDKFISSLVIPEILTGSIEHHVPLSKLESYKFDENSINYDDIKIEISKMIDFDKSKIYASNNPGYILRYKKYLYQFDPITIEVPEATTKVPFEYLLRDFLFYIKSNKDYSNLFVKGNYIKTVCNIFEDYILSWVKGEKNDIEQLINSDDLVPPYFGNVPDLNYNYIPKESTKAICKMNSLYKNIFKILLANLKIKKNKKYCMLMTQEQIDDWNDIVYNISVHTSNYQQ